MKQAVYRELSEQVPVYPGVGRLRLEETGAGLYDR